jgi:hypothetical protein
MAVSPAMRRLLRLLEIQEDQYRAALASALADLKRLEGAMAVTAERDCGGRRLVAASASTGDLEDRLAGLEETRTARRHAVALAPRIGEAKLRAGARQREFLSKRIERRQAETLVRKTESQDEIEAGRRRQQELDDWFLRGARQTQAACDGAPAKETEAMRGKTGRRQSTDRS